MSHTPEPWDANVNKRDGGGFITGRCPNRGDVDIGAEMSLEDARRIVACVNACAGIPTEDLEQPFLTERVSAHSWLLRGIPRL